MGKLRTPFVYEDKLSGLAESFPLSLQDESRFSVGLGLCDTQPADGLHPTVGRFLQTTAQGGLLKHHINDLDNIINKSVTLVGTTFFQTVDFGRVVNYVTVNFSPVSALILFFWCDPGFSILFYSMSGFVTYTLPFTGRYIYLFIDTDQGGLLSIRGFH